MSIINIRRTVDNIRHSTNSYTPVVEVVVNGIQAIDESARNDGCVLVRVIRDAQLQMDGSIPEVAGFCVEDNGIGFTEEHRESFDTLYSDKKESLGGKGFGRFTFLKYFDDVRVESTYRDAAGFCARSFQMGTKAEIIVSESVHAIDTQETGTIVRLSHKKSRTRYDKKLTTIANVLIEKLLPYFITEGYLCPRVVLCEEDGSDSIELNEFVSSELSATIREIPVVEPRFTLGREDSQFDFYVRLFKFYSPGNQKSRVSLVAHRREVSTVPLDKYVPEFSDEFYDSGESQDQEVKKNFIVKAYVFGSYLDEHVSIERGGFEFEGDGNLLFPIGQSEIERHAASIANMALGSEILSRQEKKRELVQQFVDDVAPWHKNALDEVDLSQLPFHPSEDEINAYLDKAKFRKDREIRAAVDKILTHSDWRDQQDRVAEIANRISDSSRDELAHYIAKRRWILEMFEKSLAWDESGKYSSEGLVHDIIFPRKENTDSIPFEEHNLWLVDERLNFTSFVRSDIPLNGGTTARPDILVWDKPRMFRGGNEASNPVTIFEFKKPQREDFANPSSREDPIQQIIRYVNSIKSGAFRTNEGRKIVVADSTPFYGYVVCDLTPKVEDWLFSEKNFTAMPDRQGWFTWYANLNLYMEVLSWEKVLRDAGCRNKIFFEKLNI